MKPGFINSSPHFFRIVKVSALLLIILLLILSSLIQAPLQEPADPAVTPNPIKSAWFLLWIQEVVSYSTSMIYAVIAAAAGFLLLPWLSRTYVRQARWFAREQTLVNIITILLFLAILTLTIVALFRGKNWAFA